MNVKKVIANGVGVLLGGGLMYALAAKSGIRRNPGVAAIAVEGGSVVGGALLGYHLSNFLINHLGAGSGAVDSLPLNNQATSLPSGNAPVETPSATAAMGSVASRAAAVAAASEGGGGTPVATAAAVGSGQVIDIGPSSSVSGMDPQNGGNVYPIGGAAGGPR